MASGPFIEEGVLVGDGLTILSTCTIEEAQQTMEEEPLIKRGLRTFELRKGLVDLVDRADVRVVQRGRSFRFPLETAESLCVVGEFVGEELQGDVTTELEVFPFVDHTHPPASDPIEDAVMGNCLTHGLRGRGHWLAMLGGGQVASQ